jgi:hypothetical protein
MSRPLLQILFSLGLLVLLTGFGSAQTSDTGIPETDSLSWYIQMKYGLDQELYNGLQYHKRNVQYKGDPYFPEDVFYKGSVTIKGVKYEPEWLKYDSYLQDLILEYTDFQGRYNQLILNNIQVESFCLGSFCFQNLSLADDPHRFYQVLESGHVSCYIHWRREIHATHDDLKYSHEYTRPIGTYFIRYGDQLYSFVNRKEILGIFPDSVQPEMKKYLRKQHFQLRETGPNEIQGLINFISSLLETSARL